MELTYLDYLFLDLYSTEESRKTNSLFHILTGKRTVSVLMQALRMNVEAYYALFPKLQQTFFEERINQMIRSGFINSNHQLTLEGERKKSQYFDTHTRPQQKDRLIYQAILALFKARILFLTQVLSERAHANKKYYPIQPRLFEQRWLKSFIQEHALTSINECKKFGEEWLRILDEPMIKNPTVFVEQIEGYHKSKLTNNQISDKHETDAIEVYVQLQENWIQIIAWAHENSQEYPLFSSVLEGLMENAGLCSDSTKETYRFFAEGLSIQQIADRRQLKESTINDHLTEMAILYEGFPYERFLNDSQLAYMDAKISNAEKIDYSEIQAAFPGVTFFQSRLMQVKGEVHYARK